MELNKTPLTYQQASELLGVSLETIKKAVLRDVLTRLPREGLYQHLMVGQVQLFKGKMLSLSALNDSDRKLWQAYTDSINQPVAASTPYQLASNMLHSPGVERATAMTQRVGNAAYSVPVGTSLDAVAQALTRPDVIAGLVALGTLTAISSNQQIDGKWLLGAGVLLGLVILAIYLLNYLDKNEIEEVVNQIEDADQRKAITAILNDESTLEQLREFIAA